jgi:hypothetical protein
VTEDDDWDDGWVTPGLAAARAAGMDYRTFMAVRSRAQRLSWLAIKSGKLQRQPCEVCGATKVHGHHDDYTKPLDVRWLCPLHHRRLHSALDRERGVTG